MKSIVLFSLIALIAGTVAAQSSDMLKQNIVYKVDEFGNANIEIGSKLTASQWQRWENSYGGNNISILKRDIERSLNSFYLYDFDYDQNDMDRSYTISFKAKGVARYEGNGKWLAEMGMKDPDFSKLTDNSYLVTNAINEGGLLIQQNNTIFFPAGAKNIEEDTDEFGYAVFKYTQSPSGGGSPLFLILGLVFIVAGVGLGVYFGLKK